MNHIVYREEPGTQGRPLFLGSTINIIILIWRLFYSEWLGRKKKKGRQCGRMSMAAFRFSMWGTKYTYLEQQWNNGFSALLSWPGRIWWVVVDSCQLRAIGKYVAINVTYCKVESSSCHPLWASIASCGLYLYDVVVTWERSGSERHGTRDTGTCFWQLTH